MTAIESSSFPKLIAPDPSAPDLSSSLPGKPVHESAQTQIPKLKNNGKKGTAREAFSLSEYKSLTSYMPHWVGKGHTAKTREMRELLRDYVLILVNTGMRHGTETKELKWRDIEWITKNKEQYLRNKMMNGKRVIFFR
jgi:integrase